MCNDRVAQISAMKILASPRSKDAAPVYSERLPNWGDKFMNEWHVYLDAWPL